MIRKRIELILASIIIVFSVILIATENNEVKKNVELEIIPINRSDGTVDFQVRTISYNGAYAPAHCLAIWVCDENDNFIRTIVRRALSYSQHLVKWNQMTNGDDTNALITGASPNVHTTWTFNWDCKDRFDEMIPDGIYKVYVEFTEDNSLLIPVNGPWTMVEFTKGDQAQTVTPAGDQFFQDINLEFVPTGPQNPSVVITYPYQGDEISILPLYILFDVENFPLDSGTINLFINDEFVTQQINSSGILIYELPNGDVELTLKLYDNQGQPFDPPAEDSVNIFYNPANSIQNTVNSVITKLDNFPNPFNPSTTIDFSIRTDSNIELLIFNSKGQLINTLVQSEYKKGSYSVIWNGDDETGNLVSSGFYLYKLKANGKIDAVKKCLLMK